MKTVKLKLIHGVYCDLNKGESLYPLPKRYKKIVGFNAPPGITARFDDENNCVILGGALKDDVRDGLHIYVEE